jgi:hypothetical protein
MVILCNIAVWNKDNINLLAKTINPDSIIFNTSSFRKFDEFNIISEFYNDMGHNNKYNPKNEDEDEEIINRCRVLRLLKIDEARNKVTAMRRSITKALKSQAIDLVITELVDQYFHDILVREAKKLNILIVSPVQTFVNGYSRLTLYGENQVSRVPDNEEVNLVFEQLNNQAYEPNYVTDLKVSNYSQHLKRVSKNMLRYIYFSLRLLNPNDKYDYHYLASSKGILRYGSIFNITKFKAHSDWKNKISNSSKPTLYMPLQWFPESTVDYWCKNINVIDYENVFVKTIQKLSSDFKIVIKEHPGALGFRNPSFIKKVNSLLCEDIFFVPSYIRSNFIVSKVNSVLVWTGSVGFEAAFRGKPVFTMGDPYYSSGRFFYNVNLQTSIFEFLNFINTIEKNPVNELEKKLLVSQLISGFIKGFFRNDGSFDNNNKKHKTEIITLANNISKYLLVK